MNEQPTSSEIPQGVTVQPPSPSTPPKVGGVKQLAVEFFQKIRSNKKIFWLITALFSFMALIILAGIIFRLTGKKEVKVAQTPTPIPLNQTNIKEEEKEPLDLAKEELIKLDAQIKDFDINQKRLSLPAVNFNIEF